MLIETEKGAFNIMFGQSQPVCSNAGILEAAASKAYKDSGPADPQGPKDKTPPALAGKTGGKPKKAETYTKKDLARKYEGDLEKDGLSFLLKKLDLEGSKAVLIDWNEIAENVQTCNSKKELLKAHFRKKGNLNRMLATFQLN